MPTAGWDLSTAQLVPASEAVTLGLLERLLRQDRRRLLGWMLTEKATDNRYEPVKSALFRALFQRLARKGKRLRIRGFDRPGKVSSLSSMMGQAFIAASGQLRHVAGVYDPANEG